MRFSREIFSKNWLKNLKKGLKSPKNPKNPPVLRGFIIIYILTLKIFTTPIGKTGFLGFYIKCIKSSRL